MTHVMATVTPVGHIHAVVPRGRSIRLVVYYRGGLRWLVRPWGRGASGCNTDKFGPTSLIQKVI